MAFGVLLVRGVSVGFVSLGWWLSLGISLGPAWGSNVVAGLDPACGFSLAAPLCCHIVVVGLLVVQRLTTRVALRRSRGAYVDLLWHVAWFHRRTLRCPMTVGHWHLHVHSWACVWRLCRQTSPRSLCNFGCMSVVHSTLSALAFRLQLQHQPLW